MLPTSPVASLAIPMLCRRAKTEFSCSKFNDHYRVSTPLKESRTITYKKQYHSICCVPESSSTPLLSLQTLKNIPLQTLLRRLVPNTLSGWWLDGKHMGFGGDLQTTMANWVCYQHWWSLMTKSMILLDIDSFSFFQKKKEQTLERTPGQPVADPVSLFHRPGKRGPVGCERGTWSQANRPGYPPPLGGWARHSHHLGSCFFLDRRGKKNKTKASWEFLGLGLGHALKVSFG